jgi:hypothetical protein
MIDRPFLTLIDPRAKIKGSRDPLGLQPIWTRFGRQVVYNLTTVTTSLRGFTVLLLGLYFAERTVEELRAEEARFADLFLKFEQLAAYSRVAWREGDGYSEDEIRGIQRVQRNLNEGKGRVRISADQERQILANQKTYGLWGLYSVAARNSSWLEPDGPRLIHRPDAPTVRDYIETEYLPKLARGGESILAFLKKDRYFEPCGKDSLLGRSLANLLNPEITESERAFYFRHLIAGGRDNAQQMLWEHIVHATYS